MYVELKNVNKNYGSFQASKDINFGIEKGKLIALLGSSGSGKTTILRMIAGLETPDSGDIFIDGVRVNDIPPSQRGIGFVFQNYALFRYMTVYDNIAFGLKVQKKSKQEIHDRVMELIELIGLSGLEKRYPYQLSGGQRQRVAFARALAPNPHLLLLDEPFAAIDAKVRKELRSWLKDMITKVGITSIFVTHDQEEAVEVADEIIITSHGQVEQIGTPMEIYQKPETAFVAHFVGDATEIENYGEFKGFSYEEKFKQAMVRPEFLKISKKGTVQQYEKSTETAVVEQVSFRGSYQEVKLLVNGNHLTATWSLEKDKLEVGEEVNVFIYRMYLYEDRDTKLVENQNLLATADSSMVI